MGGDALIARRRAENESLARTLRVLQLCRIPHRLEQRKDGPGYQLVMKPVGDDDQP